MRSVTITFSEADLDADGYWLMDVARQQERKNVFRLHRSSNGVTHLIIGDNGSDDIFGINLRDDLSFITRSLKFGCVGLSLTADQWSGQFSEIGHNPIPTQEWAELVERTFNHPRCDHQWQIPEHLKQMARNGTPGARIINQAAVQLRKYLEVGCFSIVSAVEPNNATGTMEPQDRFDS